MWRWGSGSKQNRVLWPMVPFHIQNLQIAFLLENADTLGGPARFTATEQSRRIGRFNAGARLLRWMIPLVVTGTVGSRILECGGFNSVDLQSLQLKKTLKRVWASAIRNNLNTSVPMTEKAQSPRSETLGNELFWGELGRRRAETRFHFQNVFSGWNGSRNCSGRPTNLPEHLRFEYVAEDGTPQAPGDDSPRSRFFGATIEILNVCRDFSTLYGWRQFELRLLPISTEVLPLQKVAANERRHHHAGFDKGIASVWVIDSQYWKMSVQWWVLWCREVERIVWIFGLRGYRRGVERFRLRSDWGLRGY